MSDQITYNPLTGKLEVASGGASPAGIRVQSPRPLQQTSTSTGERFLTVSEEAWGRIGTLMFWLMLGGAAYMIYASFANGAPFWSGVGATLLGGLIGLGVGLAGGLLIVNVWRLLQSGLLFLLVSLRTAFIGAIGGGLAYAALWLIRRFLDTIP